MTTELECGIIPSDAPGWSIAYVKDGSGRSVFRSIMNEMVTDLAHGGIDAIHTDMMQEWYRRYQGVNTGNSHIGTPYYLNHDKENETASNKSRVFFWIFLAIQALFVLLLLLTLGSTTECSDELCEAFSNITLTLKLTELMSFWAVVNTAIGFSYVGWRNNA